MGNWLWRSFDFGFASAQDDIRVSGFASAEDDIRVSGFASAENETKMIATLWRLQGSFYKTTIYRKDDTHEMAYSIGHTRFRILLQKNS